jgi:hypothetical protein
LQKAYIETILEHFCLQDAKTTPISTNTGTVLSMDQLSSTSDETNKIGDIPYQRGIGPLIYTTTSTHHNIAFPIAILSQNPGRIHWEVVKDVIHYLKDMVDLTLTPGGTSKGLEAYVNADWASQPHRHSMLGYTILLHSSPIVCSAQKQTIIALSTAEAEYIALTTVMREILYLQALIAELYELIIPLITVYCDNQGAVVLTVRDICPFPYLPSLLLYSPIIPSPHPHSPMLICTLPHSLYHH